MAGKDKRTGLPWRSDYTKQFAKSWERYRRTGRYDMQRAAQAMLHILSPDPIPEEYLDHALTGEYGGFRELHIGGDFLLVYRVVNASHTIIFTDIGTHAELFQ